MRGEAGYVGRDGIPRLNVLELQRYIRSMPKPVIALVAGYAIGGGQVLHVICDLTIAAENAFLARGACWTINDQILFSPNSNSGIWIADAA